MAGFAFALLALVACGNEDPTGPGEDELDGDWGFLTATIDGEAWESDTRYLAEQGGVRQTHSGRYPVRGYRTSSAGDIVAVFVELRNIPGPGTYPLGTGAGIAGGIGAVLETVASPLGRSWSTPFEGANGTVTITALTEARIAGTFAFTATPLSDDATGTRSVAGEFDLALTTSGTVAPYPASAASTGSARLDGQSFHPVTIGRSVSAGRLAFALATVNRSIDVIIEDYVGPGTYELSYAPARRIHIRPDPRYGTQCTPTTQPAHNCWGGHAITNAAGDVVIFHDTGSIAVTSHTAERLQGVFSGVLGSWYDWDPEMLVEGQFDIGLGQAP